MRAAKLDTFAPTFVTQAKPAGVGSTGAKMMFFDDFRVVRWVGPVALGIALMAPQAARSAEDPPAPAVAAAPSPATAPVMLTTHADAPRVQSANVDAVRPERDTQAGPDRTAVDRPVLRSRRARRDRDDDRPSPRLRQQAANIPWHRAGGGGLGLILGVGY
jgi:hypothetical protein